MFTTSKGKERR